METKEFTDTQIQMLKKMLEWDDEYYYPYFYFDDLAPDKVLKKEMRGLIARGYVNLMRGGINDEGQICGGSGFCLNYERRQEVKDLTLHTIQTV
jgi:hypothetical protein